MSEHENLQEAEGDNKKLNQKKTDITNDINSSNEDVNQNKTFEEPTQEIDENNSMIEGLQEYNRPVVINSETENKFESFSLDDLVIHFESLLEKENSQNVRDDINLIKNSFNTVFANLIAEKKEKFLTEGGNAIDFNFKSPVKKKFNDLSKVFRERQKSFQKDRSKQLNQNLEIRLQIIEEIKGLINAESDINSSYRIFKNLQERWRSTGQIPSTENNNTWNNYRHHVEIFYGFLHLNRDLRDLDAIGIQSKKNKNGLTKKQYALAKAGIIQTDKLKQKEERLNFLAEERRSVLSSLPGPIQDMVSGAQRFGKALALAAGPIVLIGAIAVAAFGEPTQ